MVFLWAAGFLLLVIFTIHLDNKAELRGTSNKYGGKNYLITNNIDPKDLPGKLELIIVPYPGIVFDEVSVATDNDKNIIGSAYVQARSADSFENIYLYYKINYNAKINIQKNGFVYKNLAFEVTVNQLGQHSDPALFVYRIEMFKNKLIIANHE